jgi:hypothetical protein
VLLNINNSLISDLVTKASLNSTFSNNSKYLFLNPNANIVYILYYLCACCSPECKLSSDNVCLYSSIIYSFICSHSSQQTPGRLLRKTFSWNFPSSIQQIFIKLLLCTRPYARWQRYNHWVKADTAPALVTLTV